MAQLSDTSSVDFFAMNSEFDSDEANLDIGSVEKQTRIKWEFRDKTWNEF